MNPVGIAGAAGRMGQALIRAVAEHPQLTLAAAWEKPGHDRLGQDAGSVAGLAPAGVEVRAADRIPWRNIRVAMDFTAPAATLALAEAARRERCALVIGTTGFQAGELEQLRAAAAEIPVVYATNFSTGINVLWKLARVAAAALGESYDAEIIEAHHRHKKDAPSGTAMTLYQEVCRAKGLDPATAARHGRQGLTGERTASEVGLHAIRAGDIVGDHTLVLAGPGERLEIKHQAHSRETLARGAARAAAWVLQQPPGWYGMAEVLGLNG